VIVSDEKVYAFGRNDHGQLGLGNQTPTDIPTPVCGLEEFVPLKVSCGKFHTALHTGLYGGDGPLLLRWFSQYWIGCIVNTIGTQLTVLYRKVSLIQR